jgi:hypothetical protein
MKSFAPLPRRAALVFGATLAITALHLATGTLAGCGSTTGQRITLGTRVLAEEGIAAPFENAFGWKVQLTKAHLSIGELYYFSGPPVVASLPPARRAPSWRDPFTLRAAHAHPGHYTEGDALGQMLTPETADLLVETDLADAEAVTGRYESARFSFASPPQGDLAADLSGHVVWVNGEATKGSTTLLFRARANAEDILNTNGEPWVEGCVFDAADIEAEGTVTLIVHPAVWFDQVDFADAPPWLEGERVDLPPGEPTHKAFVRGLKKGTAYTFAYAP